MRIHVNLPQPCSADNASSSSSTLLSQAPAPLTALTPSGELILIELQGSLEIEHQRPSGGQVLGTLTFDPLRPDRPVLMVSHHRLEGKFVSLVRPLAVLEKKVRPGKKITEGVLVDVVNKRGSEEERVGTVKKARRDEEAEPLTPRKPTRDSLDFSSSPPQPTPVKSRPLGKPSELDTVDENEEGELEEAQTAIYYDVVNVIRRKILFSKRPEPIVKLNTSPSITRALST
ncbi:Chromosome transmission fidelity protein 8 [Kalmanozyma brasiliensis GHG001]|uniref:Chromosome transmission fidelity protein 8 n=1 Tax=Kalmanozyma brasiliensis (strain GHG001) TaxID=1365824 RepID=V5E4T3_KALBG|nr:Chromosome transmission fidelity protein 8 [Kalmanozyma brasiliensis GHG001]EST05221.1 Chromosome transmission fidelity protein 8 [Kalmanozyma brasiliensis GHG001]